METVQSNSTSNEYLYGQALYPAPPLSWLAPMCFYVCGVATSAAWTWTGSSLLCLCLGLLLVGPLLGTGWAASRQIQSYANPAEHPLGDAGQKPLPALPYTLAGSAGHRLARWLGAVSAWWEQAKPRLGKPVLWLVVSTIFSLTVAAELGQQTLILAAVAVIAAYVSAQSRWRWVYSLIVTISLPLSCAWLLGHSTYAALRPASAFVAASFALAFYGCSFVDRTGKGLWRQVVPQAAVVVSLLVARQPAAAAVVALLGSSQLLLVPLLKTPAGRAQYFRTVQPQLAASMLLTALAVGYRP